MKKKYQSLNPTSGKSPPVPRILMNMFSSFKKRVTDYLPLPIAPLSWFMCALQFYYLYEVFATNDTGGLSFTFWSICIVIWSMVTIAVTFQWLGHISQNRWVTVFLSGWGLLAYTITAAYHFGSHDMLEWSVAADNITIAFSSEAFDVMIHALDQTALQYGLIIGCIFAFLEIRKRTVSKITPSPLTLNKRLGSFGLFLFVFILPIDSLDPLLNFLRTGYFYYRNEHAIQLTVADNEFPFQRAFKPSGVIQHTARPNIFLIVVESLNASAIDNVSEEGVPYTPFLNKLKNQSVYVDPFYGNSIQTAKGHFGLFFSTIPAIRGKAFVKHPDLDVDSVASVLKKYEYQTHVFAAHDNPNFDNISGFLTQRGFDSYQVIEPFLTEIDKKNKMKWGVKDEVFYQRFFDYYDTTIDPSRPLFVSLLTIANHFPFNSLAAADRHVYTNPQSINQHYANSVRMVDDGIRQFYEELKKRDLYESSIVIITGDHAFPLGEHGNYHLEAGYHDDSFRIPFFLTWPDHLKPQVIRSARSQLDINPTILDLLNISQSNSHFIGHSIFDGQEQRPIYLVQPYAKHFSVIKYPFKYRFFAKTEQEYVYDLEKDPMETKSITKTVPTELMDHFRQELKKIYLSHEVLEKNQFKPPISLKKD